MIVLGSAQLTHATASTPPVPPRAWRRALNGLTTLVSVVVAVIGTLALVLAIASHLVPNNGAFSVAGHPLFVVLSGSMSPVIDTGDLVIDHHPAAGEALRLHAGQIITVNRGPGETPITHRIVAASAEDGTVAYITKGDANGAADRTAVQPSQVIGVYDFKLPLLGRVMVALRQPLTLALLVAAPVLWLLSGLFYGWAREVDQDTSDRAGTPP